MLLCAPSLHGRVSPDRYSEPCSVTIDLDFVADVKLSLSLEGICSRFSFSFSSMSRVSSGFRIALLQPDRSGTEYLSRPTGVASHVHCARIKKNSIVKDSASMMQMNTLLVVLQSSQSRVEE